LQEGRTALFYCCVLKDPKETWELLEGAGADPTVTDSQARIAAYYIDHRNEIELPDTRDFSGSFRRFTSGKDGESLYRPLLQSPADIRPLLALSSGIQRRVVRWTSTDISEEHVTSVYSVE
jgi:hypothetical protein